MKIKTKPLSYEEVMSLPRPAELTPKRPNLLFRSLMRLAGIPDLRQTHFTYTKRRMEEAGPGPYLILMNHSSFIDLEIASRILFPKPYCIVCTSDGFVGKSWLMRQLGCIPTRKFVTDIGLVGNIHRTLTQLHTSVLMYPEASYSFDGCATPLPRKMGVLLKRLNVPVLYIHTSGAFARDPLYNCLQKRKVNVSTELSCLFTAQEIREKSVAELDALLDEAFSFDNFAWQRQQHLEITEPFRADGLNRILYHCVACGTEGQMEGKGTRLICHHCGKEYELDTLGQLRALDGMTEFSHIPDWYNWERKQVRQAISAGRYRLDIPVDIGMMVDYQAIYMVGEGRLVHDETGFTLTGCDGKLCYQQSVSASYSLYSDYFWYELGDIICIGNQDALYYCFPRQGDVVAKTRIATEELYRLYRQKKKSAKMPKESG